MTLQMVLRSTSFTTVVTAIVACVGYLFLNSSAIVVIATAAIFAIYIAISTEAFQVLYKRVPPVYGMVYFSVLGIVVYTLISKALGQPLFSETMKDGMIGCAAFTLFGGCALLLSEAEDSALSFYAFSGMLAGFAFQPILAACGFASAPNLNLAMTGAIVGAGVALVQLYFANRERRNFLNGINKGFRI